MNLSVLHGAKEIHMFRVICPEATYYFNDLQDAVICQCDFGGILQYRKNDTWKDVESE